MKNEFSSETKELFYASRYCMLCGHTNFALELHHICGRSSNSAFNCSRLCKTCHEEILHTQEYERILFEKTKRYLVQKSYLAKAKDYEFLISNQHLIVG